MEMSWEYSSQAKNYKEELRHVKKISYARDARSS